MGDLEKVIAKFNKWSDQHNPGYSAWVMTPQFRSADDEFHVGWIGAWADGATMGAGMQSYRSMGEDLAQDFDNVIDCSGSHMLTSTWQTRAPIEGTDGSGLLLFSSCTLAEGKTGAELQLHTRKYLLRWPTWAVKWPLGLCFQHWARVI